VTEFVHNTVIGHHLVIIASLPSFTTHHTPLFREYFWHYCYRLIC